MAPQQGRGQPKTILLALDCINDSTEGCVNRHRDRYSPGMAYRHACGTYSCMHGCNEGSQRRRKSAQKRENPIADTIAKVHFLDILLAGGRFFCSFGLCFGFLSRLSRSRMKTLLVVAALAAAAAQDGTRGNFCPNYLGSKRALLDGYTGYGMLMLSQAVGVLLKSSYRRSSDVN